MSRSLDDSTAPRLIVADGDLDRGASIASYLRQAGFQTHVVQIDDVLAQRTVYSPASILMDVSLAERGGLDLCMKLRAEGYAGGLILTHAEGSEIDLVAGLDAGADDYIVGALRVGELPARINAVIRRLRRQGQPGEIVTPGGLRIDMSTGVTRVGDTDLGLGSRQREILLRLVRRYGKAVPRAELHRPDSHRASLDVAISRLRVRMREAGAGEQVMNVQGYGFRLTTTGRDADGDSVEP